MQDKNSMKAVIRCDLYKEISTIPNFAQCNDCIENNCYGKKFLSCMDSLAGEYKKRPDKIMLENRAVDEFITWVKTKRPELPVPVDRQY